MAWVRGIERRFVFNRGSRYRRDCLPNFGIDAPCRRVMTRKGYRVFSPQDDERRAGIVMFSHAGHTNEALLDVLTQAGVAAAVRGGRVRFSPHFYNTEDEIAQAVDALP